MNIPKDIVEPAPALAPAPAPATAIIDLHKIRANARAGAIPPGVQLVYFVESKRNIVVAYRDHGDGTLAAGYVVFHRLKPDDQFDRAAKAGHRATAVVRLSSRPIHVAGPDADQIEQRKDETAEAFADRRRHWAQQRIEEWNECFGRNVETSLKQWPSPVRRCAQCTERQYSLAVACANKAFADAHGMTEDKVAQLRAAKARILALRRKFIREIPVRHPYAANSSE